MISDKIKSLRQLALNIEKLSDLGMANAAIKLLVECPNHCLPEFSYGYKDFLFDLKGKLIGPVEIERFLLSLK